MRLRVLLKNRCVTGVQAQPDPHPALRATFSRREKD